ncbi:MAG: SAM-dependent chlorinase/fluorinase, partial [Atopobiaceae bacterium]|nr:SAM-dependent chlorinase/fluorinase [Atopobiaceae bacterium]
DTWSASYRLYQSLPFWPEGTIYVSVVDPGVGTSRRACVARTASGHLVVTPDNGTLTLLVDDIVEVRQVDETKNRLPGSENVHIFHGRDVFSFTAARLASGIIRYEQVGPTYPISEIERVNLTNVSPSVGDGWAEGGVYNFDVPYGSARINVKNSDFQKVAGFSYGDLFHVTVADGNDIIYEGVGRYGRTFGEVADCEANVVGDIQHGDRQMLRFSTRGNFIREYAPQI